MSIKSHLESAEESLRQAIINSLADKKDENLSDLFQALALVKDINSKTFEFNPGNINLSDVDYSVLNNDPITFSSEICSIFFQPKALTIFPFLVSVLVVIWMQWMILHLLRDQSICLALLVKM